MSTEGPAGSHPKEALSWRTMALALNLESQPGGGGRQENRKNICQCPESLHSITQSTKHKGQTVSWPDDRVAGSIEDSFPQAEGELRVSSSIRSGSIPLPQILVLTSPLLVLSGLG